MGDSDYEYNYTIEAIEVEVTSPTKTDDYKPEFLILRIHHHIHHPQEKSPRRLLIHRDLLKLRVVPPGIEPGTPGFSVLCSTN